MASEVVVKKRGRPKKTEATVVVVQPTAEADVATNIAIKTRKPRTKKSATKDVLTEPKPNQITASAVSYSSKKQETVHTGKDSSSASLNSDIRHASSEAKSPIIQAANAFSEPKEAKLATQITSVTSSKATFASTPETQKQTDSAVTNSTVSSKAPTSILTKLGLDSKHSTDEANAKQVELVERMIQAKRTKLISTLSARLDHLAEQRITTAMSLNDLRMSSAANDVVSIATGIGTRRAKALQVEAQSMSSTFSNIPIESTTPTPTPTSTTNPRNTAKVSSAPRPSPVIPQSRLRASDPVQRPAPSRPAKRPTEMSYEELRKTPEFKRLSWSWTGIIVGVPVLLVTSWLMWKDYNRRIMERKLGLDGSLARGPVVPGSNAGQLTDEE